MNADVSASGISAIYHTSSDGYYQLTVPYGWSGTVSVSSNALIQIPTHSYTNVTVDTSGQNFIAVGFVDMQAGLPGGYVAALADYDNDNDLDLVCGSDTSTRVYRNNAGAFVQTSTPMASSGSTVQWGDVDNNGYADLLLGGSIYMDPGGTTGTGMTGLPGIVPDCMRLADFDNDGLMDVVECGWRSYAQTWVMHNNGNGTFSEVPAGIAGVRFGSLACADYDNDGDMDFAIQGIHATDNYTFVGKIYRNDGNGVFTDIQAGLTGYANGSIAWGDYDHDGDLDLAMAGACSWDSTLSYMWRAGASGIYRNDGNGQFVFLGNCGGLTDAEIAWGDLENDGDLDLWAVGDWVSTTYDTHKYVVLRFPQHKRRHILGYMDERRGCNLPIALTR